MYTLRLTADAGATIYSHDAAVLAGGDVAAAPLEDLTGLTLSQEATTDEVRAGEVDVVVAGSVLMGVGSIFDLPAMPWRAELTMDDVVVVGGLVRGEPTYDQEADRWTLTIQDDALPAALEAWQDTRPFRPVVGVYPIAALRVGHPSFVQGAAGDVSVWLSLATAWIYVANSAPGVTVEPMASPWMAYETTYDDSGTSRTITRATSAALFVEDADTLQGWSGRHVLDICARLNAWTLRASYAPFPSTDITVTIDSQLDLAGAEGLPDLDGRIAEGGYVLARTEGEDTDLVVTYDNDAENRAGMSAAWDSAAVRLDVDGEIDHETVISLPFLPVLTDVNASTITQTPDAVSHSGYSEQVFWSGYDPTGDAQAVIAAIMPWPDGSGGQATDAIGQPVWAVVRGRRRAGTTAGLTHELRASEIVRRYALSAPDVVECEGSFVVDDLDLVAGLPRKGARLLGRDWLITRLDVDVETQVADLTMRTPLEVPS